MKFSDEEDQRLTAYALGELDGEERAVVETRLREDAGARATVAEIRAVAERLAAALENEAAVPAAAVDPYRPAKTARMLRFPQVYYVVGGLAAACFAVVVALHEPRPAASKIAAKQYVSVPVNLPVAGEGQEIALPTGNFEAPVQMPMMQEEEGGLLAELRLEQAEKKALGAVILPSRIPPSPDAKVAFASGERVKLNRAAVQKAVARANHAGGAGGFAVGMDVDHSKRREVRALDTETYAYRRESDFLSAKENPLSTFSVDVDTASYANVRRFLSAGERPPADAVRIEEMVNYFSYRYAAPEKGREGDVAVPFAASMEVAEAPWAPGHRLVRIGLKGREVATAERAAANLVFLLDVSGSMNVANKLPLVKESLRLLVGRLRADDRVAIVTYAGGSGLALPSTPVAKRREIEAAIEELQAQGATNGAMGIELAYDIAKANFVSGGVNRVVLCTDGDFNVGVTSEGELVRLITEKAKTDVFLTVLGFGMGNLKDATLEKLADSGNGGYGYVDTRREAERLLVEQVSGTLVTIAKDVKLQVEFNPARVASYRLIGYENRMLKKEDFNNDGVDAGEIGAGHTVTALYEIVPAGRGAGTGVAGAEGAGVEPLKYAAPEAPAAGLQAPHSAELLTLKVRYKEPAGEESRKLEFALTDAGRAFGEASEDFRFAAAVAGFGMLLRESPYRGNTTFAAVADWAAAGVGVDAGGYRAEFLELVRRAERM